MVTLAQELTITDILGGDEPLADAVSAFLDGIQTRPYPIYDEPLAVTRKINPAACDVIKIFTTEQVRGELAGIFQTKIREEGNEKL